MPKGLIVKALSGFYYVLPEGEEDTSRTVQCRARGVFKIKGVSPLVGDRVVYDVAESGDGTVLEVLPRTTELVRPPVANADTAVLVFSVAEPELNLRLLDRFLVHTEFAELNTIICFSKTDVADYDEAFLKHALELYEGIGYPAVAASSQAGDGLEELTSLLEGKITVLAGQSGVGKSSLLNALVPGIRLETGEVSARLGRGRHTTRHVELIPLPNGGIVADTPGFSQLDFQGIEAEQLSHCFREFQSWAADCKFRGCLHRNEPGCEVKAAVELGNIAATRYENYSIFLEEIGEMKRRY